MNKQELKQQVFDVIDAHREELIGIGHTIMQNPELGFKEFATSQLVKDTFAKIGLNYQDGMAITGVKAKAEGKNHVRNVAILGELDSVLCFDHPYANKETGAAHACGHNAQITTMLGAAMGLVYSGAINELDGDVSFIAVPAEEFVEMEFRNNLRKEGKIYFLAGKNEMIKAGAFDDVDMAMMCHAGATPDPNTSVWAGANGFMGKLINFKGKNAHAGGAPHLGINALNAATLAISAINAQRETFQDQDRVRVHPIITKGGDLVNIIPSDVRIETHVRAANIPAFQDASKKVNRAVQGAAYAMGAEVEIIEVPGHLPLQNNADLCKVIDQNTLPFAKQENILYMPGMGGTTDMGDVSSIMPAAHMTYGGYQGGAHQADFFVSDDEAAYITPAKIMAATVIDLLSDGAAKADEICNNYKAPLKKEEYMEFWSGLLEG